MKKEFFSYLVCPVTKRELLLFADNYFDKVFCYGVLQHTPCPKKAFFNLVKALKQNGQIATDVYIKSWKSYFHIKPYVRRLVKKMPAEKLYRLTKRYVNCIWPIAKLMRGVVLSMLLFLVIPERSDPASI